ncbi:MAG: hypothetical protein K0Q78_50 [Cellvibrio sp.]|nr:hypothetical protein [Cellvibrio sp.]
MKELRENILSYTKNKEFKTSEFFPKQLDSILKKYQIGLHKLERSGDAVSRQRSEEMKKAAATAKTPGLWKVGDDHIEDILKKPEGEIAGVSLLTKKEFNDDYDKWKSSSPVAASNLTSSSASSSDKSEGDAASSSSSSKVDKEVLVTSSPSIAASASTVSSSPALQHFEQLSGTAAVNSSLSALPLGPQQERMI